MNLCRIITDWARLRLRAIWPRPAALQSPAVPGWRCGASPAGLSWWTASYPPKRWGAAGHE